ncbi:MAG: TonB-dependent receptor, partial [Bacteroidia bacterium]|nr:TonB-dependent receptor [Bacteroidia bacterium]
MITISAGRTNSFICGYLIDNESRFPVQAVTIVGNIDRTTSDEFGYFKLKINQENEKIYIRHLGFQSLSISPNLFIDNKCQNLYLVPQIEALSEVILRNYITKGIDKMFDGSFNINFSDFGILPGLIETDVLQTIQALPGIQSIDETVSDINIRGGTHDQNLILWDGIKMYQSGHFFGLISIFNPSITTDVALIKNGTDVDLSDGVSGTISMKTTNEVNDEFTGSVASNFINVDAFIDVPTGPRSSFQLSARKAISDIAETPTYDEYFKRILQDTEINPSIDTDIKFDFYDTSFRWLYDITEKDQIRLNFLYVDNTLVFNETGTFEDIEESKESNLKQITIAEGLMYKRKWNHKFVTTFQAYETDYELKSENVDLNANQRVNHQNKVSESSFKLNTFYKYNDQLSFLNGYQFTETGVTNLIEVDNPLIRQGTIEVLREHSAFSQVNYISNSKHTHIKAGARYGFIEQFNTHIIEPRISVSQKIVDFLSLELLGEMKHQNTSQIIRPEVEFLGVEKRRWRLSNNADIPLLKSKQASIGLNYKNGGWLISTDVYYKEVNGITTQSQGFLNQYQGIDAKGSYNIKGLDFLVNKNFNKVSTWLSYSYGENEYNFNDLE